MSEVNESAAWRGDFTGLRDEDLRKVANGYSYSYSAVGGGAAAAAGNVGDWKFQAVEFAKGAAEMSVEFGKGVRDVVNQSILREDSIIMRKFKGPCVKILGKLRFLNEYLPEDRDPVHVWAVFACVWIFAFAALIVNNTQTTTPLVKRMKMHPTSASLVLLPDGRRLAYQEQGVPANQARFSMIVPHSFLSSRLAGIPGLKGALLQEFGVRMVTYDLPGFGQSDPHPVRNLESSALDMLHLSYALNVTDKFWVVGYSDGSKHALAALNYIPDRIAGAIMMAPMVNPYEPRLTKEERRRIWGKLTVKKKLMYFLARKFPRLLPYYYRRSFLSGNHGQIEKWLSISLGERDRAVIEGRVFEEFWQRNVEESVRQANPKPFVEEAILQISNWGFAISDLNLQNNKHKGKGVLDWLKSLYTPAERRLSGFLGPIHIWQGAEDTVVPPSMSEFVHRVLPDSMLHKLPYEGHFSYFYFCDECHRQIFTVVYGNPQGPLAMKDDQTHINPRATEYGVVLSGAGTIQIVYPNGSLAMNAKVTEGDVFWIPRYFPFCQIASRTGPFEFFGFTTSARDNRPQFLVGANSLLHTLRGPELAAAYGLTEERLNEILDAQRETTILPSATVSPPDAAKLDGGEVEKVIRGFGSDVVIGFD